MPYATHRDRTPALLEISKAPWPQPPLNLFMRSGYLPGVFDLWWSNPAELAINSRFHLIGVNVWRSFDSEYGPYHRLTSIPLGGSCWRDQTDNVREEEDVSDQFIFKGVCNASGRYEPRYVFRTRRTPIVKSGSQNVLADNPRDVEVFVDGVRANVKSVNGFSGEVELDNIDRPEVGTQTLTKAVIPGPNSVVTCSYVWNRSYVKTDLSQHIFYRVTTVGIPVNAKQVCPEEMVETPLEFAAATSNLEIEKLDYIWKEGVRRNKFILEQGGERVKVFIRKNVGIPCPCTPDWYHKQPISDCEKCYGVGIIGGFEGPFDILIAPDDAERRISQKETGRTVEHSYEVWTGPSPLVSQRDFIVKINGERYSIGPVRMPTNRGMVLQQHFNINIFDTTDIRYAVPVVPKPLYEEVEFVPHSPEYEASANITDKPNIPDERELRGRSLAWVNIMYLFPKE